MVSIIIPLYNVENYVIESLKSAFSQTYSNIEYLLIDDCSTDQTMQVVEEYVSTHLCGESIRIIHHDKNRGLSAARNTGMKCAKGEFVFFMDSDDEISPDCIEKHYLALKNSDADLSIADIYLEGSKSIHIKPLSDEVKRIPLRMSFFERMWNISACNKLYRKKFLKNNGFTFQERLLHEDILWSYNIASKARKVIVVTETTYIYKIHKDSITTYKNSAQKIESLLFILRTIYLDWECGNIPIEYKKEYFKFIDFWRLNTALLLLNYNGNYRERTFYYSKIKKVAKGKVKNLYSFTLRLPFCLFYVLVTPIYFMYKKVGNLSQKK